MVYAGGIIIECVKKSRLELDLHCVVRLRAFLLDMDHPPESALSDTLDVQEVVRRDLNEKHRRSTEANPHGLSEAGVLQSNVVDHGSVVYRLAKKA